MTTIEPADGTWSDSEYATNERGKKSNRYKRWVHTCPACGQPVGDGPGLNKLSYHLWKHHGPEDFPP